MSAIMETKSRSLPAAWQAPLLALATFLLLLVFLYRESLLAMVGIWERSGTFAHCYLVAPISIWLIWRRRQELALLTPKVDRIWVLPMVTVAAGWLLGDLASINALTQFAFTAMLVLAVPFLLGREVAVRLTFPLLFLFFMVPFGEFLMPTMIDWTADFTVAALRLTGIPVYREGNQFIIPTGSWSVVEACSGIRYLIASLMVGSLFAYLNYNSAKRRLLFGLVSLAVPLVANWIRAYMIVMMGHLSGNKLAVGVDHLIYGWVFFGLVIGIMFYVGSRWTQPERAPAVASAGPTPVAAPLAVAPVAASALVGALILVMPHVVEKGVDTLSGANRAVASLVLPSLDGAKAADAKLPLIPSLELPSATASQAYEVGGGLVYVHVAYYRNQTYGRKLVSSENVLVKTEDPAWQILGKSAIELPSGATPLLWRSVELLSGGVSSALGQRRRLDVRQIYWSDGQWTSSNAWATAYAVRGRLAGQGDDAALVTIYTEGSDRGQTQARLRSFIQAHTEAIHRQLVTYRTQR